MKLNQVIAVEKGIKNRTQTAITEAYHKGQKAGLFLGFSKKYNPRDVDGEVLPAESKKVEVKVKELLTSVQANLDLLFNITATKDYANCLAKADLVVDGTVLLKDVPATYLLFLEKQLVDLRTSVDALPVLDPTQDWMYDENVQVYKTEATQSIRTKKVQRPIVLIAPTTEHPGQAQLITEDQTVGTWSAINMSGAISQPDKVKLVNKVQQLIVAVKQSREQANMVDAKEVSVTPVLNWIFNS